MDTCKENTKKRWKRELISLPFIVHSAIKVSRSEAPTRLVELPSPAMDLNILKQTRHICTNSV